MEADLGEIGLLPRLLSDGVPGAYEYLCQVILFAHLDRTDQETPTHAVLSNNTPTEQR